MNDLDDLLNDLSRGSVSAKTSTKKARPASSFVDMNDLDSLMADLGAAGGGGGGLGGGKAGGVRVSTLDFGLDDLNTNQPKKPAPSASHYGKTPTPAANNSRVSELDFGLGDLGAPSKPAPSKAPATSMYGKTPVAPASNNAPRVSTLDFGLDDLTSAAPPKKQAPSQTQYGKPPTGGAAAAPRVSTLDFGLDDLSSASSSKPAAGRGTGNKPAAAQAPRVSTLDFGLDDLTSAAPSKPAAGRGGAAPKSQQAPRVSTLDFGLDDLAGPSKPAGRGGSGGGGGAAAAPADDDDLESLMNSLSNAPQPAAAPSVGGGGAVVDDVCDVAKGGGGGGSDLDSLLSNLSGQMSGVDESNPSGRGKCAKCKQDIVGEVLQAMGRYWHPEHWACENCGKAIGTDDFYDQDGAPHCAPCYKQSFCPRCAHCNEAILDRCVTALGKKWHPEHFICQQCLKGFPTGQFFERDNKPYCEQCFGAVHAPRCAACDAPIQGDCVNALGNQYHPKCFVCTYCQCSFGGGSFFEMGGKPYCATHYNAQTGSVCGGCGKSISGRSVAALGKKFHPEHFVCSFCMNVLAGGKYSEKNGKAYCNECHGKLFAK